MNTNTIFCQPFYGGPDIHGIVTQPIQLGNDENITWLQSIQQLGKLWSLKCRNTPTDVFCHDPAWIDGKTSLDDFLELVISVLISCADSGIDKNTGHVDTLAHYLGNWSTKLRRRDQAETMRKLLQPGANLDQKENHIITEPATSPAGEVNAADEVSTETEETVSPP